MRNEKCVTTETKITFHYDAVATNKKVITTNYSKRTSATI